MSKLASISYTNDKLGGGIVLDTTKIVTKETLNTYYKNKYDASKVSQYSDIQCIKEEDIIMSTPIWILAIYSLNKNNFYNIEIAYNMESTDANRDLYCMLTTDSSATIYRITPTGSTYNISSFYDLSSEIGRYYMRTPGKKYIYYKNSTTQKKVITSCSGKNLSDYDRVPNGRLYCYCDGDTVSLSGKNIYTASSTVAVSYTVDTSTGTMSKNVSTNNSCTYIPVRKSEEGLYLLVSPDKSSLGDIPNGVVLYKGDDYTNLPTSTLGTDTCPWIATYGNNNSPCIGATGFSYTKSMHSYYYQPEPGVRHPINTTTWQYDTSVNYSEMSEFVFEYLGGMYEAGGKVITNYTDFTFEQIFQ